MRKSDKLKNFKKANLLAENRYLESKGFEVESYNEIDETQMDVNEVMDPRTEEIALKNVTKELYDLLYKSTSPFGYLSIENVRTIRPEQISPKNLNDRVDNIIKYLNDNKLSSHNYDSTDYKGQWDKIENPEIKLYEDNLPLYKAEMKKTGDYPFTANSDEEIRNKKSNEGFKHNFTQKYMEQTINTTDGVYTFDQIKFVSNYGDYEVIFTRPSNDNDNVIRGDEILLWLVYDVTNGYYIKNNKQGIKLTDKDSIDKVIQMLSYNEFIQPEK